MNWRLYEKRRGNPLKRRGTLITVLVLASLLGLFRLALCRPGVKIGLLLDLSGKTREVGKAAQRVAEMAVDMVNDQGGVGGQLVELVAFDTRGDPIRGKHGTRDLLSDWRVSAVVGPADWATAMMTKPFFETRQVPVMMLTWEDSVIRGGKFGMYEWIFQLPLRETLALEKICAFARARGWRRLALVVGSDVRGREARYWFDRMSAAYGIEEVAVASFIPSEDVTEKLAGLVVEDPQVVVSWCSFNEATIVARILRGVTRALPLFQCHEISPQRYVEAVGPAARTSLFVSNKIMVWQDLEEEDPQKEMIQDFVHRYRDIYRYEGSQPICPFMGYVWDSVMILVRAMRETGTYRAWVRDAIEEIQNYVGLGGVYGFSHEDHNGLGLDSVVVMEVERIDGDGRRWVGSWKLAD